MWNDTWVSQLELPRKLLFIYLLTNEHTNISGIYELPLKIIAAESGIDFSALEIMMPHLAPKIYYHEGWVIVPNFLKYQNITNSKIITGIRAVLSNTPQHIQDVAMTHGWAMDGQSHLNPNLNPNLNLNPKAKDFFQKRGEFTKKFKIGG